MLHRITLQSAISTLGIAAWKLATERAVGKGQTLSTANIRILLGLGNCTVGHPEYIGDGWCDGGADDATYVSAACKLRLRRVQV